MAGRVAGAKSDTTVTLSSAVGKDSGASTVSSLTSASSASGGGNIWEAELTGEHAVLNPPPSERAGQCFAYKWAMGWGGGGIRREVTKLVGWGGGESEAGVLKQ